LRLKASRGDLHTSVAVGYVRSADDRLEIDPDNLAPGMPRSLLKKGNCSPCI